MAEPRVWVGCLGCYNAGGLVGAWVDALEAEELEPHAQAAVSQPAVCGDPKAEERWVFDLEGFGGFLEGECSPSEAHRVAEMMAAIEADGFDLEAVSAYVGNVGWSDRTAKTWENVREGFEDAYAGEADSGADYAAELAEELGAFVVEAGGYGGEPVDLEARWPFSCIDWERAWRELELGDGYWTAPAPSGGVYVFRAG